MAKLGNDWLWIGLGIAAIYGAYKLGNPLKQVGEDVARVTGATAGLVETVGNAASGAVVAATTPFTLSNPSGLPSVSDFLFKSPLVTVPATAKYLIDSGQYSSNRKRTQSTPLAPPPSTIRAQTNIAASQGLVSVAPPQMSMSQNAAISPFTGQPYLQTTAQKTASVASTSTMKTAVTAVSSTTQKKVPQVYSSKGSRPARGF
jgi:hypothetical protein